MGNRGPWAVDGGGWFAPFIAGHRQYVPPLARGLAFAVGGRGWGKVPQEWMRFRQCGWANAGIACGPTGRISARR
jgi:hypothetical protein